MVEKIGMPEFKKPVNPVPEPNEAMEALMKQAEVKEGVETEATIVGEKVKKEKGFFAKIFGGNEEKMVARGEKRLYGDPELKAKYESILASKGEREATKFATENPGKIKGNPTLRGEYERLKTSDAEKATKFAIAVGKYNSIKWNEAKKDYVDAASYTIGGGAPGSKS